MKTDARLLADLGIFLYGPSWQTHMACTLGVHLKTVQRWRQGKWPVPGDVWPKLAAELDAHERGLARLRLRLNSISEVRSS